MDDWIILSYIYIYIYIYAMEYSSALQKDAILSFRTTWMKLEDIMLSKLWQMQNDKGCMILLICEI
jgi:hypothetical protein